MKNFGSLFVAYMFVWAIFFIYQITLSGRVSRLRGDVQRLKETLRPG
jgi:hypothetical protein